MATFSEEDIIKTVKDTDLKHIAVIMDGNRRWAKERCLPSAVGHKKGVSALKATMRACDDFGIKYLTVYAFGMISMKDFIKMSIVRCFIYVVGFFAILIPYWIIIGLI